MQKGQCVWTTWREKEYPGVVTGSSGEYIDVLGENGHVYMFEPGSVRPYDQTVYRFALGQHVERCEWDNRNRWKPGTIEKIVSDNVYNILTNGVIFNKIPGTALRSIGSSPEKREELQKRYDRILKRSPLKKCDPHLEVRVSTLENAGLGLFTTKPFATGITLGIYHGLVSTFQDEDKLSPYIVSIIPPKEYNKLTGKAGLIVDGKHVFKKNLVKFVNDCRDPKGYNAEIVRKDLVVFVRTTREIPAGAEIFANYKEEYWEEVTSKPNDIINSLRLIQAEESSSSWMHLIDDVVLPAVSGEINVPPDMTEPLHELMVMPPMSLQQARDLLWLLASKATPLGPLLEVPSIPDDFVVLCLSMAHSTDDLMAAIRQVISRGIDKSKIRDRLVSCQRYGIRWHDLEFFAQRRRRNRRALQLLVDSNPTEEQIREVVSYHAGDEEYDEFNGYTMSEDEGALDAEPVSNYGPEMEVSWR